MSRFQLSLNVDDVGSAVTFYTKLFGVGPAKQREGYANFIVEDPPMKLVVIEDEGAPGTINHVGIEFPDGEHVAAETSRIAEEGLPVLVDDVHTCCFATQEKAWTRDVDGVPWELYTVVADTEHFGANSHALEQLLPSVTTAQLTAAIDDAATVIIDAQGDGKFEQAHVPGAIDFGFDDVLDQAAAAIPDQSTPVVVYCTDHDCQGAEFVGTQLVQAGYTNVKRFPGGIRQWADEQQPTRRSSQ